MSSGKNSRGSTTAGKAAPASSSRGYGIGGLLTRAGDAVSNFANSWSNYVEELLLPEEIREGNGRRLLSSAISSVWSNPLSLGTILAELQDFVKDDIKMRRIFIAQNDVPDLFWNFQKLHIQNLFLPWGTRADDPSVLRRRRHDDKPVKTKNGVISRTPSGQSLQSGGHRRGSTTSERRGGAPTSAGAPRGGVRVVDPSAAAPSFSPDRSADTASQPQTPSSRRSARRVDAAATAPGGAAASTAATAPGGATATDPSQPPPGPPSPPPPPSTRLYEKPHLPNILKVLNKQVFHALCYFEFFDLAHQLGDEKVKRAHLNLGGCQRVVDYFETEELSLQSLGSEVVEDGVTFSIHMFPVSFPPCFRSQLLSLALVSTVVVVQHGS